MSEAAAEGPTRTRPAASSGASGNVFTRKFGPLPGWGWAAVAGVAAIGYMWYRNRSGAAAAANAAATQPDTAAAVGDDIQGQLATLQTEIQDLQGTESTEAEGTGSGGSTSGGGKNRKVRHVSTGKETLNQIAKADRTSVAHIVSVSRSSGENDPNLDKLQAWAAHPHTRRRGVVYYTN